MKQILKISILGMPMSGRKSFLEALFQLKILEGLPKNPHIGFMDTPFYFQPARLSDLFMARKEKWKDFYEKIFLFQLSSGPSLAASLIQEMLLRDVDGVLFMINLTPGTLSGNEKALQVFHSHFSQFHSEDFKTLPFLFCYNFADSFSQKLSQIGDSSSSSSSLLLPQRDSEDRVTLRPAYSQEEKYIFNLNKRLNPQSLPFVVTAASLNFGIEAGFEKLLEQLKEKLL